MKKSLKIHLVILGASVVYTVAPIVAVFASLGLANLANCEGVNEASEPRCEIEAVAGLVYTGFVSGWLALITIPTGGPVALGLLVGLPIHYFVAKKRDRPKPSEPTVKDGAAED